MTTMCFTLSADFLRTRLAMLQHEVFTLIFVDNRHRLIACEELIVAGGGTASFAERGLL